MSEGEHTQGEEKLRVPTVDESILWSVRLLQESALLHMGVITPEGQQPIRDLDESARALKAAELLAGEMEGRLEDELKGEMDKALQLLRFQLAKGHYDLSAIALGLMEDPLTGTKAADNQLAERRIADYRRVIGELEPGLESGLINDLAEMLKYLEANLKSG